MTARPPAETLEALSDGSEESPAGQAGTGHETNGSGGAGHATKIDASEASISKTLEAILSKSDDEESPFSSTHEVGTKTLLGMNAADLLPKVSSHDPHDGIDIKSEDPISGVTVDDLFADSDDDAPTIAKPRTSVDDTQVGTLLGEVAEALNVQAAESRQRALGRSSSPAAARPPAKAKPEEFEFEDPDDGPTSLNAKGEVEGDAPAGDSSAEDDEEEAVVLGPARKSDKHSALSGPPGSRPAAAPTSTRPLPGTRRATPFAGLPSATLPTFPTPAGGRSRLPTPAPGQAVSIPAPAGAGGRSAPPPGRPSGAHATLEGMGAPVAPTSGRDSSRRTAARTTTSGGLDSLEGNGAVGESLTASAMNTASTILKKDLRLKLASLAAIVVLTFVGGMLLGRSKSGDSKVEVAGDRSAAEPAKPAVAAPAAAPPAEAPAAVAQPANPPPAAPVAAPVAKPPEAVAVDPAAAASADAQALRKHRARRPNPVAKDDVMAKVSAPKPAARPAAGFPPPAPAAKVAAKPASGGGGGKKKAAWHDPFAD